MNHNDPDPIPGKGNARAPRGLSRREFVRTLAVATGGTGLVAAAFKGLYLTPGQRHEVAEAMSDALGPLPRRQHGRTKMKITPIVISQDWAPELYAPALDAGMNYVHKAGYWKELPEEFKGRKRDSYYTDITVDSTPRAPDDEDRAYKQVIAALERTGLRYFDIFRAHFGWHTVADMREKRGTYRAFQRLKREGKCRFFGVSQHDYVPYPEILAAQIEDGLIDSIQIFYSHGATKELNEVLNQAHKAGIGLIAMKVYNNGARSMRKDTARMAALKATGRVGRALYRHVLTEKAQDGKPLIDAAVSAMQNLTQFEENVGAVSTRVAAREGFDLLV